MMDPPPPPPPSSRRAPQPGNDPSVLPPPPRAAVFSKAIIVPDGEAPPPPPTAGPNVEGRDKILLEMQKKIFNFYFNADQSKLEPSVFALALQLWWDEGLVKLNEVFLKKYGKQIDDRVDILDEFDRKGEDVTIVPKVDLHGEAGEKHLLVKTILKTNNGDFFHSDKRANSARFVASQRVRNEESMGDLGASRDVSAPVAQKSSKKKNRKNNKSKRGGKTKRSHRRKQESEEEEEDENEKQDSDE